MELKSAQQDLNRLKLSEEVRTLEYVRLVFGRHSKLLDISNHFIFEQSSKLLCNLMKHYLRKGNSFKSLVLKNCMLSDTVLKQIFRVLAKTGAEAELRVLDLANNRLNLSSEVARRIARLFSAGRTKGKALVLQGNIVSDPTGLAMLFSYEFPLVELNLYDTNLSEDALAILCQVLSKNRHIQDLDLGFNLEAFTSDDLIVQFARSVSENSHLEKLNLSGNEGIVALSVFEEFCKGISSNRSLQSMNMASLGLEDNQIPVLCTALLSRMPLCSLDLQNNNLTAIGIAELIENLPSTLSSLDLSYNEIKDSTAILSLSGQLIHTKSLRKLNISHTMELDELDEQVIEKLCEALTRNDSLTEFYCEGVKISENPDEFCSQINEAISLRKLSLTYRVSAVNCYSESKSSVLKTMSSSGSQYKVVSLAPSGTSSATLLEGSYQETERRDFSGMDTEDLITVRQHNFNGGNNGV